MICLGSLGPACPASDSSLGTSSRLRPCFVKAPFFKTSALQFKKKSSYFLRSHSDVNDNNIVINIFFFLVWKWKLEERLIRARCVSWDIIEISPLLRNVVRGKKWSGMKVKFSPSKCACASKRQWEFSYIVIIDPYDYYIIIFILFSFIRQRELEERLIFAWCVPWDI